MRTPLLLALFALASTVSAEMQVWVVDSLGFGDFTEIQPAIDAASPGDTVFVRWGTYPAFTLGKGLTVTAAQDTEVRVEHFAITGIASGEHAIVRGFEADGTVTVADNAGVVELAELERDYGSSRRCQSRHCASWTLMQSSWRAPSSRAVPRLRHNCPELDWS